MIHSDRHQINAALAWVTAVGSWRVLREYRYKCILMSRSVSVFPSASHFHITYLVPLINFVLRLFSLAIQRAQPPRIALSHDPRSFPPLLSSSLSSLSSLFSIPILRVNIIESPRIPFLLLFTTQRILNESSEART